MDTLYRAVRRSTALEETIRREVAERGLITFARFMELALYHPELGYYRTEEAPMTRQGDYLTSPETHPVFGALLARFARAASAALGSRSITVVEQGAGTGALAESVLRYWQRVYPGQPILYLIIEPDAGVRERLSERLGSPVCILPTLEEAAPIDGVYWSNELPDAFPVHRVRNRNGVLVEVMVGCEGGHLLETEGPLSSPDLEVELDRAGIVLNEGQEIEVNPGVRPWIRSVGNALSRGYALTIDYGYTAAEAGRFPRGTLLAHYRHSANEDFLERIGRQDLTAHVCWDAVERAGDEAGLSVVERTTQRDFLTRWGWKEYGRWLLARGESRHIELDAVDRLGRNVDGLGGLGVLLQARGALPAPAPEMADDPVWESVTP